MKLLLDENLSRRIVSLIASHYPGSSQVALLGLERASDTAIWAYARQHDFIIVTKDSDFVDLSTVYGPVSYTHLAVYKRQIFCWSRVRWCGRDCSRRVRRRG